jgi:hypothetical protein
MHNLLTQDQMPFPRAQVSSAIFLDPLSLMMEQEIDHA